MNLIVSLLCDLFFAGASCPASRRDLSLPVWWSLEHDVLLLKAFAIECLPPSKRESIESGVDRTAADSEAPPGAIWDAVVRSKLLTPAPGFRMPSASGTLTNFYADQLMPFNCAW